jgi:Flp pilus assembly protein TadD
MPRFAAALGAVALSAVLFAPAPAKTQEPQSSAMTLNQSLEAGIRDAQTKRSQRDFNGAIHVLSQLMLVAPDDPRVVGEYGKVLVQQGRARDALDFLNRAVQLQQGDWMLFSALGVAYDQTADYASARNAYERALQLNPGETAVLNNYAMSRALAGDLAEAKRLISQASAGSSDERIARNLKMINALTPLSGAIAKPAPPKTVASAPAPHSVTQPKTVMMQAVPADPKAGTMNKPKTRKPAATTTAPKTPVPNGIPALRLANDRQ